MSKCACISSNDPRDTQRVPAVVLTYPFEDRTVSIDACIAETIQRLWAADINTFGSCCGHGEVLPSVVIDGHSKHAAAVEAGRRASAVIAESDAREWSVLSWVLTEVGRSAEPVPEPREEGTDG